MFDLSDRAYTAERWILLVCRAAAQALWPSDEAEVNEEGTSAHFSFLLLFFCSSYTDSINYISHSTFAMDDASSSTPTPTLLHAAEDRITRAIYSGDATKINAARGDTDWLLRNLRHADVERFLREKILPEIESLMIRGCHSPSEVDILQGLADLRMSIMDGLLPPPTQQSHTIEATLTLRPSSLRDGDPTGGTTKDIRLRAAGIDR